MAALESHLTTLNRALLRFAPPRELDGTASDIALANEAHEQQKDQLKSRQAQSISRTMDISPKDGLNFTSGKGITGQVHGGETSVLHALRRVEDRLTELGVPIVEERDSAPETPPMTPLIPNSSDLNGSQPGHEVARVLLKHGVTPNLEEWNVYMDTFLDEVHILYPFLSEPLIRTMFEKLWLKISTPGTDNLDDKSETDLVVQALLILANGRCGISSRVQSSEGSSSAGWSLYCSAMEIQGSLLETVSDDSRPLSSLHTLILIVSIALPIRNIF